MRGKSCKGGLHELKRSVGQWQQQSVFITFKHQHPKASTSEVEIRFGAVVSTFKPHKATNGRMSRATWEKAVMKKAM